MKLFKRITILLCVVIGIVAFWLVPGINKATDVRYTRLYEDTDLKKVTIDSSHLKLTGDTSVHSLRAKPRINYKRESIRSSEKIKNIEPKMFSRAMQFEPELEIIVIDSLNQKVVEDSSKLIQ